MKRQQQQQQQQIITIQILAPTTINLQILTNVQSRET